LLNKTVIWQLVRHARCSANDLPLLFDAGLVVGEDDSRITKTKYRTNIHLYFV